jgi:BMFP domain-containing protein YqiC
MLEPRFFDELARRLSALVASTPAKDVEKNLRALLTSAMGRLDLVTREEFDLQRDALTKARDQLAELEARIAEMDARAGH